ncbi:MAG: hypothetical protein IJS07_06085 [Bacteroidales bacterium]|nr:hypothetical protein [Bacteroidales bacterium]
MKKFVIAVLAASMFFGGSILSAQSKYGPDSLNCIKYLSYYSEYYKQKNYDDALPNWRQAFKICPPQARQGIFVDGAKLIREQIRKNQKNQVYREALVDTLMMLYDIRVQYYPSYTVSALNNKGMDMAMYIKNDPARVYKGYTDIVNTLGAQTSPAIFINQFVAATELYNTDELSMEQVIETYETAQSLLAEAKGDAEKLAKARTDLESLFIASKVASCESMVELFTPRFEAAPDDLELATKIVKMLSSAGDCMDNDLYLNAVTTMHRLNPNHSSAYFLYKLNAARGNSSEAISYLESAIADEGSDALKDGEYNYELAVYCHKNGQAVKAAAAAKKAIDLNPAFTGKANYVLGTIWGSVTCSRDANEIERRAPYWVAVDYLTKAKAADESLTEDANKLIASFRAYFPQKAEAFMYDVTDGQSYTVNCGGLSATTVVRTQN